MRLSLVLSLIPLGGLVGALSVTEPKKGADISASKSFTVKWTSVDTDASSFDLYLVNNAVYPNVEKKLASGVDTSKGSYTVDALSGVTAGHGYQIDLMSDSPDNTGILAQSEQFNVTGSAHTSSTSASTTSSVASTTESSTTASTANTLITTTSAVSATGTETASGSATAGSASGTGTSASGTSSETAVPSTGVGAAILAHPAAAVGLLAGALAFNL
ncbi:hypothetical protein N7462_004847 [Penicillium macrosclerotiorum]|uniref:uncharacterized protein n=1 Tax=Penicillium macrosclerotiorum TaxID=303699 RepID=UPI00254967F9|nr:uncharacterized protein N7462_004847 [Penicillium macrosclerotiorum]KAJ5690455.1 hypothetical protein N7462_004847 [Penicillium macrosclerotiorum]